MIYIAKFDVKEDAFLDLLSRTRILILNCLKEKDVSPNQFETVVFDQMCEAAKQTEFEGSIKRASAHSFPDIVANKYFGVEVKMTSQDHWISTGNSVLESLRVADVERVYIVFGKFGGKFFQHRGQGRATAQNIYPAVGDGMVASVLVTTQG